jgi:di/tricarboxylate transporter
VRREPGHSDLDPCRIGARWRDPPAESGDEVAAAQPSRYTCRTMDWQGWFTLAVLAATIIAMAREVASPDVVLMGGLFTLAAAGVLTPTETFAGFSNQSMATVGALLVLSAALRDTGAVEAFFGRIFGRSRSELVGLARNSPDFYLVSEVSDSEPPRFDRARLVLCVLGSLVFVVWMEWLPISIASFLAAGALIATRCTSAARARAAIVYGPGGYRYTDFVRIGLPLDLLCGAVAIGVIPAVWRL